MLAEYMIIDVTRGWHWTSEGTTGLDVRIRAAFLDGRDHRAYLDAHAIVNRDAVRRVAAA